MTNHSIVYESRKPVRETNHARYLYGLILLCASSGCALPRCQVVSPENADKVRKLSEIHDYFYLDTFLRAQYDEAGLENIALSSNGRVAWGDARGMVIIWDLKSWRKERQIPGRTSFNALAFSPDGKLLAISTRLLDVESGETVAKMEPIPRGTVTAIAFSSDGTKIAGGGNLAYPVIWDVKTGRKVRTLVPTNFDRVDIGCVYKISFSSDSKIVAACWGKTARVWRVEDGQEIAKFSFPGITAISLSPFGRTIALGGGSERNITIWDVNSGDQVGVLKGHNSTVKFVEFTPDGRVLVSIARRDHSIRFWDVEKKECVNVIQPVKVGYAADFSSDGRLLAISRLPEVVAFYGIPGSDESPKDGGVTEAKPKTFTNSIGMEFILIPAGKFMMGSSENEEGRANDEGPQHRVHIGNAFYIGRFEVTQEQYEAVMGKNPSSNCLGNFMGLNRPVVGVRWRDAVEFCRKLSKKEGSKYRLPTEAEWEYACRAGRQTRFSYGNDPNYRELGEHAWYYKNSKDSYRWAQTHPVGQKAPNAWGLYDMHGNVWEWCSDWYDKDYYARAPRRDPKGPDSGRWRVLRGGSWLNASYCLRAAYRGRSDPANEESPRIGFRCVVSVCP